MRRFWNFIRSHPVLVATLAPLLIGGLVIISAISLFERSFNHTRESGDVSRYAEFRREFNPKYTSHLPSAIPPSARGATLSFMQAVGGIGPSNIRLGVAFTVEPDEAKRLLADARAALAAANLDPQIVSQGERNATVQTGDRIGALEIDPDSGSVWIRLGVN